MAKSSATPQAFAVGTRVKMRANRRASWEFGTVISSNAIITNVSRYNKTLGREVIGSWRTESVKIA